MQTYAKTFGSVKHALALFVAAVLVGAFAISSFIETGRYEADAHAGNISESKPATNDVNKGNADNGWTQDTPATLTNWTIFCAESEVEIEKEGSEHRSDLCQAFFTPSLLRKFRTQGSLVDFHEERWRDKFARSTVMTRGPPRESRA